MTPPISKDWWLAAALSTATVPAATLAQNPAGAAGGVESAAETARVAACARSGGPSRASAAPKSNNKNR